jgi:5'-methylthioadenosine phosphorylase
MRVMEGRSRRWPNRGYRSWGMDIIGMTNLQGGSCPRGGNLHSTIALVTDYDCGTGSRSGHGGMIIGNLTQNAKMAQQVIASAIDRLPFDRTCECASALKYAIITRPDAVPQQVRRDLAPLVGRYL